MLLQPKVAETPYVITYFDVEEGTPSFQLVVANIGTEPATRVSFQFDPPLASTAGELGSELALLAGMPFLPPGQTVKSFFDSSISLYNSDLPLKYTVAVSFSDLSGEKNYQVTYDLDLAFFRGVRYTIRKKLDDQVRELSDISRAVSGTQREIDKLAQAAWAIVGDRVAGRWGGGD